MKRLIFAVLFSFTATVYSQNLIDNQWQFAKGDSLEWKELSFNATQWKTIKSGLKWEEQGFANYDGFAWFRKAVVVPNSLKKTIVKQGGLTLNLGTIDDADQIYFNGKLLGETGKMPPHYLGAYDKIRKWDINPSDIRWDKENVIAVRVYDDAGGGGITGTEISLAPKGIATKLNFTLQFPNADRVIFQNNLTFNTKFENKTNANIVGKLYYFVISDMKDTLLSWTSEAKLAKGKVKAENIVKDKLAPGFYTLFVEFKSSQYNFDRNYNFGVDPEKIVSPTDRPQDFENFWMRAKKELAAVDPQFKMIRKDSLCTDKRDVFLVEMRSLENVLIRGWYARPKAPGKYPAIMHVQGYSTNQEMSWGYGGDDMAVLVLNVRGHGNSRDNVNPGFPGYLQYSIKDKERYIYRGAYLDCARAVDFLCSRPEVDTRYIAVKGGSQGGALSFATASLNNDRIALCMPSVPFLSDFRDYFKIAHWPANEFEAYVKSNPDITMEKVYQTLSYFDIKNLAPWVKCPVIMSIGLLDTTCPPHINFAAYNQLNVPKSYLVYPDAGHGLPSEATVAEDVWMKKELEKLGVTKQK